MWTAVAWRGVLPATHVLRVLQLAWQQTIAVTFTPAKQMKMRFQEYNLLNVTHMFSQSRNLFISLGTQDILVFVF
jgi:hypothetical protein